MIRQVIKIDEEKCNGCGLCAKACHEMAIGIVDGKAKLLRDDYCDGFGDCLPNCPSGAISFETREAASYNRQAVEKNMAAQKLKESNSTISSCLTNWPIQIKLAQVQSQGFKDAHLLIASDCSAFTYGNFHEHFIKGKTVLIGCPKLDGIDYSEKLGLIFATNTIKEITIVRNEVPCCGGLVNAVNKALNQARKNIAVNVVIISNDGQILK